GHTLNHVDLTQVDADTARREICDDRAALVADGFDATTLAYPFGASNAAVEDIARSCGYTAARDIGGLSSNASCTECPYANPMPPADAYLVRTAPSVAGFVTVDSLAAYVMNAEAHGGGWMPFVFHHVCEACSTNA